MIFRTAKSFYKALARLSNAEAKQVKLTVFDLQADPAHPGHSFHKLDRAADPDFWSVRVNRDLRLIVHKKGESLLVVHVDHHDAAYAWAERRRIAVHPRTRALQIVELHERRETVDAAPSAGEAPAVALKVASEPRDRFLPPLFKALSRDDLLDVGVPEDWIEDVLEASEDRFLDLADHLPEEAAEALFAYAATGRLEKPEPVPAETDPFEHPDALRRFRTMEDRDVLERALDAPWEQWSVFLHPAQKRFAEATHRGPARVTGSAGTGKTVVALHRAVNLARANPDARVLLTTFSPGLAAALKLKLSRLCGAETDLSRRIQVETLEQLAYRLHTERFGQPNIASPSQVRAALKHAAEAEAPDAFTLAFLEAEWTNVVDAWCLQSWEAYHDVPRLGRKARLGPKQRETAWAIFERARARLAERGLTTWPAVFARLADACAGRQAPFDHVVVDEAQDLSVPELKFLAALSGTRRDGLFFTGDLGQRIFRPPFSWRRLGVDVRGRSATLRVNYRTSHQIRSRADRLLPDAVRDVDGEESDRRGTVSVFNGPEPLVEIADDEADEIARVAAFITAQVEGGVAPEEIALFVRTAPLLGRARAAAKAAGYETVELDAQTAPVAGRISIATMHWAKGMEFRAVAVMACDDEVVPLQERIETIADQADLDEVYETERHLLYVACTRARDALLVTGVDPASEFVDDLA
ncbi:MAG: 3'-5' exonuclease [Oceanicaulis sp.]